MAYRRPERGELFKVAVRAIEGVVIHQGNHSAAFPGIANPAYVCDAIEVRHFPYRSVEQFVSKARNGAAAYASTDLHPSLGNHWRTFGRVLEERGEKGIARIFRREHYSETAEGLIHDPCPQ